MLKQKELLSKRLKKDPKGLIAVGNKADIMQLVHSFMNAGVQKFVLRPLASGTQDMIEQTQKLIEEVLPDIAALRQKPQG